MKRIFDESLINTQPPIGKLFRADGSVVLVKPRNDRFFELPELREMLECDYIEIVRPVSEHDAVLVIDERGKLTGKPHNVLATGIWHSGATYRWSDPIVGNALLCLFSALQDDEERAGKQE